MSLIPGNVETLAFGIQVDKSTAATVPVMAIALEDCSVDPGVQRITTPETDQSALAADDVVVGAQPGGTFKKYLRPDEDDLLLYALLGKNADTGTTPKIHTANIDPAAPFASPYLTIWDIWPGIGCIQYLGARIGKVALASQEGGAVEAEYTVAALQAIMGASPPSLTGLIGSAQPFTWAELAVSLGGVHGGIVSQYQLTIDRNATHFQGDNGLQALDIPNGLLSVSGSLDVAFQDDTLWRAANTGTTAGTALTTTIFQEALVIDHVRGANLEAKFSLANARITNFKNKVQTDGKPAVSSFDFKSARSAVLTDVIQTVVKNAIVHADRT